MDRKAGSGLRPAVTGLRLRFIYRRRGPSLLVADAVRMNTRGQAAVSKSKTGRSQGSSGSNRSSGSIAEKNAPIFLLVRQIKLPKRLDLTRDAERALAGMPGMIVANWVEGRK